jgi:hypothetical protein
MRLRRQRKIRMSLRSGCILDERDYNDSMSNVQLLITVGLPMLALAFGMYLNDRRFEVINGRIDDLRTDLGGRLTRVGNAVDNLTSKLVELDNRVIRIETKLGIS